MDLVPGRNLVLITNTLKVIMTHGNNKAFETVASLAMLFLKPSAL